MHCTEDASNAGVVCSGSPEDVQLGNTAGHVNYEVLNRSYILTVIYTRWRETTM